VPSLKLLVSGLSTRVMGTSPRPGHVGFVVDRFVLQQVSLHVLRY